jgi:tRNA dimethylallyltransferase
MSNNSRKLIVIVGPTASGKSSLGVHIAKKIGGEIVSADSRQVYRGMNLGSGKITPREMRGIPHYLIDVVNPKTPFSAGAYQKRARKAFEIIWKKGKTPILVGGTGFYVDSAVFGTQFPEVPQNKRLRKSLEKLPPEKLFKKLQKLDPERAKTIDQKNPHRLIRAIEIAEALGKVPRLSHSPLKAKIIWIGICPPNEILREKIRKRLTQRVRVGMLKEIDTLHRNGVSWKRLESFGLEYKWGALLLQKKITKTEFFDGLYADIVKYAKRQMTWFKKNKDIQWFKSEIEIIDKIY